MKKKELAKLLQQAYTQGRQEALDQNELPKVIGVSAQAERQDDNDGGVDSYGRRTPLVFGFRKNEER